MKIIKYYSSQEKEILSYATQMKLEDIMLLNKPTTIKQMLQESTYTEVSEMVKALEIESRIIFAGTVGEREK